MNSPEVPEGFETGMAFDDESIPLWVRIQEAERMLYVAMKEAKVRGLKWAQLEAHYYSMKAEETLLLHEQGHTATNIANIIKGQPKTNEALERMHEAEVLYDNAKEAINVYKIIARILNDEQQREFEQAYRTT